MNKETHKIEDALELVRKQNRAKFDSTLEVHINLGIDSTNSDQQIRATTTLPHGTGKTLKVAVFASKKIAGADIQLSESDLKKIEKGSLKPGIDFDVIVSEPRYMAKIAKVAKILGPQGMMPNPKSGTVTENVEKTVGQRKKGRIEIKNEPNAPIIHTIIGKASFEDKMLKENFDEIISVIKQNRPQKVKPENLIKSVFVSSTMGPSVQIAI